LADFTKFKLGRGDSALFDAVPHTIVGY